MQGSRGDPIQVPGRLRAWLYLGLALTCLTGLSDIAPAASFSLQPANLHNPYFSDRAPDAPPGPKGHYTVAPAPARLFGIRGDTVPVPFTLLAQATQPIGLRAQIFRAGVELATLDAHSMTRMQLLRARDVHVEGNSNASCSCPAGQLPQIQPAARVVCVPAAEATEAQTPKACPTADQRAKLANSWVRLAPFSTKDALEPLPDASRPINVQAGLTELFVLELPITPSLPAGDLELRITAVSATGMTASLAYPLRVLNLSLDHFPAMDLSFWISEDPRDLVARPAGTAINGRWGGEWWSEEHWRNIEGVANLQARLGVTNTLVPLFVRSPFGIGAKPLITVRCITDAGGDTPADAAQTADAAHALDDPATQWGYEFDFTNFRRWIETFKRAGFRQFEGAHLFANEGQVPVILECDLYHGRHDAGPYARAHRILSRPVASTSEVGRSARSSNHYQQRFLPAFLTSLAQELKAAGIERRYLQHVIDENASSAEALAAYADGVALVRKHLPGIPTIDAINKYSALDYRGLVDVPVMHLILLYDDQARRPGLRREIEAAFPGHKYFYNTALREGGPNRHIDTNPMDSRTYGWLALETGFNGFLYWASNRYRYPTAKDLTNLRRPEDWDPYRYSLGPLPGGYVSPAYGAGGNWTLYPTPTGLIGSVRALRLRDGLLDHWLYMQTWAKCQREGDTQCRQALLGLRKRISANNMMIGDFSRNPADYDAAREVMIQLIER